MILTMLGGLCLVLAVLGLFFRSLRGMMRRVGVQEGRVSMEVVQRIALSQKQGIAVVRIGERVLAVSTGEGGVHTLVEMERSEVADAPVVRPLAAGDWGSAFARLVRRPAGVGDEAVPAAAFGALLETAVTRGAGSARRVPGPFGPRLKALARRTAARFAAVLVLGLALGAVPPSLAAQNAAATAQVQAPAAAAPALETGDPVVSRLAPQMDVRVGDAQSGGLRLSGTVGIVVMMGLLTLLPTLLLMMTSFTRILIVLGFLKQALGTQSVPPAPLLTAMSLLLTGFVMAPTFTEINQTALQPWLDGKIEQSEMLRTGVEPLRAFMLKQTRDSDLTTFMTLSKLPPVESAEKVPLVVLMSAFVTSELKTAFQLGFALFLPFIVIDLVVASVLSSMGMMMLPPTMVALPAKILLFVLVDGWSLMVQSLVASFH